MYRSSPPIPHCPAVCLPTLRIRVPGLERSFVGATLRLSGLSFGARELSGWCEDAIQWARWTVGIPGKEIVVEI